MSSHWIDSNIILRHLVHYLEAFKHYLEAWPTVWLGKSKRKCPEFCWKPWTGPGICRLSLLTHELYHHSFRVYIDFWGNIRNWGHVGSHFSPYIIFSGVFLGFRLSVQILVIWVSSGFCVWYRTYRNIPRVWLCVDNLLKELHIQVRDSSF